MSNETQKVDVLAVIDRLRDWLPDINHPDNQQREVIDAHNEARAAVLAVAEIIDERDALRAVLHEFQDGRRIRNVHTRQVAREIEKEALARIGGAS